MSEYINIRMSSRGKRPLRNLTPNDKVRAIQRIHNGETKASVSRAIGVPESTLRGWCKNEQKLRFMCRQVDCAPNQLQLPLCVLENQPVEKMGKFDHQLLSQKLTSLSGLNDFGELTSGYGRLPLGGADFIANSSVFHDSLMEKKALAEYMKANNIFPPDCLQSAVSGNCNNSTQENKALSELLNTNNVSLSDYRQSDAGMNSYDEKKILDEFMNVNNQPPLDKSQMEFAGLSTSKALPAGSITATNSADYSAFTLSQNSLHILSLLNPSILTSTGLNLCNANTNGSCANRGNDDRMKVPLGTSILAEGQVAQCSENNNAVSSVKTWNSDPSKDYANEVENFGTNDTNNNHDVIKTLEQKVGCADANAFPGYLTKMPNILKMPDSILNLDSKSNHNKALIEWCRLFNASLNYLAITAAAAVLQSSSIENIDNFDTIKTDQPNILPKPIKKPMEMATPLQSDDSNDGYENYESEPEDLSLRSTTSKASSSPGSRSQSPAKSMSSSSSSEGNPDS